MAKKTTRYAVYEIIDDDGDKAFAVLKMTRGPKVGVLRRITFGGNNLAEQKRFCSALATA